MNTIINNHSLTNFALKRRKNLVECFLSSLFSPEVLGQAFIRTSRQKSSTTLKNFDPSSYALRNGNFIELPFNEKDAAVLLLPVPWDVTVSSKSGTANGAENIREASLQLDIYDLKQPDLWQKGIFFLPTNERWLQKSNQLRPQAANYIDFLENGGEINEDNHFQKILNTINQTSEELNEWVYKETTKYLKKGKKIGLVGGEHSIPFGYLRALNDKYEDFGILLIDAHCDLRKAYEGFEYSHASIFHNAITQLSNLSKLVQIGIRDFCHDEMRMIQENSERIHVLFDLDIKTKQYATQTFDEIYLPFIEQLPQYVYISFDIDGLNPSLCPNTGTPVPGGLEYVEAILLIQKIIDTGRTIIGFDLSEVGGEGEWDGNVGARVLYQLCLALLHE